MPVAWMLLATGFFGVLSKPLPKRGLRFPKTVEKPPFQTWEEIERRIARGDLTAAEQAELWDCVFLTLSDIDNVHLRFDLFFHIEILIFDPALNLLIP